MKSKRQIEKEVERIWREQCESDKRHGGPDLYGWMSKDKIRRLLIRHYQGKPPEWGGPF
jgi:hypothetical protein